jgi:NAD(P)-dependent dehydrogenase (short-subunit alcohol dehydrogenase family)
MHKVALVTGASRGLGRAITLRLAKDGMTVIVHYGHNQAAADEVVAEIAAMGSKASTVQADGFQVSSINTMFEKLDVKLGRLTGDAKFDVLVNNAGTAMAKPIGDWTETEFDQQFNLNVKGLFFITQSAMPRLRDHGRILNLVPKERKITVPAGLAAFPNDALAPVPPRSLLE